MVWDGGRPSKAASNCRMALLFTASPTFAPRKTGQNCLSAEFKTPRNITDGGRHAAGTLPGPKSSVFNSIRRVEAEYKSPTIRRAPCDRNTARQLSLQTPELQVVLTYRSFFTCQQPPQMYRLEQVLTSLCHLGVC